MNELTEKNRKNRVRMCQENLSKFKDDTWRLGDVITGDEAWFYWRQSLNFTMTTQNPIFI